MTVTKRFIHGSAKRGWHNIQCFTSRHEITRRSFVLGEVLGQGGFGITYRSSDTKLHREVAIKEYYPSDCVRQDASVQPGGALSFADYENLKTEFLEEARALARFQHRNIAQVLSVFEENNTACMVMEFLKGKTLTQLLEEKSKLSESEAVGYVQQVGEALVAVHSANLIHRDIKPDNIIVCEDGRAVLIDFGLTEQKTISNSDTRRLRANSVMGTDGYAPLEQYPHSILPCGPYSDIYSLGATLYHLITGKMPMSAPVREAAATSTSSNAAMLNPRQINPQVSLNVEKAITNSMQLKAQERPQAIQEFLSQLHSYDAPTKSLSQPQYKKRAVWLGVAGVASLIFIVALNANRNTDKKQVAPIPKPTSKKIQLKPSAALQPLRLTPDSRRQGFILSSTQPLKLLRSGGNWKATQQGNRIFCRVKKYPVIVKLLANGAGNFFVQRPDNKILKPGWTVRDYKNFAHGRTIETKIGANKRRALHFRAVGQPWIYMGTFRACYALCKMAKQDLSMRQA